VIYNLARVNYAAVVVAGLTAFSFSLVWYSPLLFGSIWTEAMGEDATAMRTWKLFVAPLRELISAWVLAWLIDRLGIEDWKGAVGLGFVLWLAFYVVQLTGAVIFDGMLLAVGAIHAGDWLGKMIIMALILNAWRKPQLVKA
jgi:hypothetical protein